MEIESPEVIEAVQTSLKLGGLGHPSDEKRAREAFAKPRRRGVSIDPDAVRAYALRNYRHGVHTADKLVKIAVGRQNQTLRQR